MAPNYIPCTLTDRGAGVKSDYTPIVLVKVMKGSRRGGRKDGGLVVVVVVRARLRLEC